MYNVQLLIFVFVFCFLTLPQLGGFPLIYIMTITVLNKFYLQMSSN
jgi:hypothetical protein